MTTCSNIGKFIRDHRERKHYTISKLAELSDISDTALKNIERGDSNPKWHTLRRILSALKLDAGELNECVYEKEMVLI